MKLPALMLYHGDWLKDYISGCSLAAQGLWLRIMFLMHDSPRYGYLVTKNGSPIPPAHVAQHVGLSLGAYEALLAELDSVSVPSRTAAGVIFSRRMIRDERRRSQYRKSKKISKKEAIPQLIHTTSTPSSVAVSLTDQKHKEKSLATEWPPGFSLTEELRAYGIKHGCNPEVEWALFEAHHCAKGSKFKNWAQAWHTWVLKGVGFRAVSPAARSQAHVGASPVTISPPTVNPEALARAAKRGFR